MSKTKNMVIDQQNEKQQAIQYLTDLVATICGYYYKGRTQDSALRIHEGSCGTISIDLYNFEGDGKPVCEGLKPCTVTYDDGSTDTGHLYCMCYDADDITPQSLRSSSMELHAVSSNTVSITAVSLLISVSNLSIVLDEPLCLLCAECRSL